MPQAMKIPDAKAAMDKDMGKTRETASAAIIQSNDQKGSRSGSTKKEKVSPLCYTDGHLSYQKCRLRAEVSKVQRPGRAPR